jgi:chromosomal replication initiator protein
MKRRGAQADLPISVLQLVAEMPFETARSWRAAFNQVLAYAQISGRRLTLRLRARRSPMRNAAKKPSPQEIIDTVCSYFRISREQLAGPSRARDITYPRHVAVYLLRRFGPYPLTDIGHLLGGRDHSTVISAFKRIEREMDSYPNTRTDVQSLERLLDKTSVA